MALWGLQDQQPLLDPRREAAAQNTYKCVVACQTGLHLGMRRSELDSCSLSGQMAMLSCKELPPAACCSLECHERCPRLSRDTSVASSVQSASTDLILV